jgi:hypothetical protein
VVDGNGIIRYRRTLAQGAPAWREAEIRPVVDQALMDLLIGVDDLPEREGFSLQAAYPNPFNPATTIPYRLGGTAGRAEVSLQIVDLRGQLIRTLFRGDQERGQAYEVLWEGRDDRGQIVPSGTYLVQLNVDGDQQAHFLTLVK